MKSRLFADLEDAIQSWMDEHCEDVDWPSEYMGEQTALHMASAAEAVFDAVVEVQRYALRAGLLSETD